MRACVPWLISGPSISMRCTKRAWERRSTVVELTGFLRKFALTRAILAAPATTRRANGAYSMDRSALKKLLEDVRSGRASVAAATERLRHFPVEELGFATLDTHRALRRGFPETVYGPGKSNEQILAIV